MKILAQEVYESRSDSNYDYILEPIIAKGKTEYDGFTKRKFMKLKEQNDLALDSGMHLRQWCK
jgi:hypothetical protein